MARTRIAIIALLFIVGGIHWADFVRGIQFTSYDWQLQSMYLDATREAVATRTIPYHYSPTEHVGGQRFMGNLDATMTPDVLLLPWLTNAQFVLIHLLGFYTIGFVGCLMLARRLGMNTTTTAAMLIFFNLSGHVVSHVAVGHMWFMAYFLLPFFALILLAWCDDDRPRLNLALPMAVVIAAMIWTGGLHFAIWCCAVLGIFAAVKHRAIPAVAACAGFVVLLSAARLAPAIIAFWGHQTTFIGGYPSLRHLIDAFVVIAQPTYSAGPNARWWEYSAFVGTAGVVILAVGLALALRNNRMAAYRRLAVPLGLLAIASLGNLYGAVAQLPIPLIGVERAPTRFLILPMMIATVVALAALSDAMRRSAAARIFCLACLPFVVLQLVANRAVWTVRQADASHATEMLDAPILLAIDDPAYKLAVAAGWLVTLVTVVAIASHRLADRRGEQPARPKAIAAVAD